MSASDIRLRSFIDRVLRLKEEQDALAADIREIYAEAKADGYDKTAMGEVVGFLRKIEKKGRDAVDERGVIFDLYLTAYENGTAVATHTHAPDALSYAEQKGRADARQERAKQRMSESMDDTKAMSADAVALGLIDPASHAETVRLANAVARKYGAGVIDPEPGELTDNQEQPETATKQREHVPSQHEATDYTRAGLVVGVRQQCDTLGVTAGETASVSNSQAIPSKPADMAEEVPPSRTQASPATHSDDIDLTIPEFLRRTEGGYPKREAEEA